jgi:hypothetical protein
MIVNESTIFWCLYLIIATSIVYTLNYIIKFVIEIVINLITFLYRTVVLFYTNLIKNSI